MRALGPDSFNVVIVVIGAVLALGVAMHLAVRDAAHYPVPLEWWVDGGDPAEGPGVIEAYGCGSCHRIPGVRHAVGEVGPALIGLRQKQYIAGQIPNAPEELVRWIMHPQRIAPGTAMPDLGVTEADARDIAAYLYTID